MGDRWLTNMADILRSAGLNVIEQDGWQTRSRSSGGYDGNRPWCVMWHHTASSSGASAESDATYMSYNADAAPIANLLIARNGDVWVLAAGATNTNGSGTGDISTSRGVVPDDSMNTHAIGMEIQNTGVGQTYTAECIDAAIRTSLALCEFYGLRANDVGTHQAYAFDRKIDPAVASAVEGGWQPSSVTTSGTWSMQSLRDELMRRASSTPEPTPPPNPEEDDDMAFLIRDRENGGISLVYGDGKATGIDGNSLDAWVAKFGPWLDMDPNIYADFINKGS